MHTATQLTRSQFRIVIDARGAELETLFPNWSVHDRLGVVVHEPFGALGASHLIQLAITAFYDAKPRRRAGNLRRDDPLTLYPEVYLFHVASRHGDHRWLDVFPPRKEVLVERHAPAVLEAINDRAITRLAVPDIDSVPADHAWKEPAAARDRIATAFAYNAGGRARDADIRLTGLDPVTEFNVQKILDPAMPASSAERAEPSEGTARPPDVALRDVEAARGAARTRRELIRAAGVATETYRRIDLDDALSMLAPP